MMQQRAKLAIVGTLGLCLDLFAFRVLLGAGFELISAHMASFALAAAASFLLVAHEIPWSAYPKALAVCLLAFFLRGGVLSVATDVWGIPPETGIVLAIAAGAAVIWAGRVHVLPRARVATSVHWGTAALGIVLYVLALRLVFLGSLNLLPEEAYYWNYAQHLDIGYLDHPPMVAWLIWGTTSLLGDGEFGVRSGAYLCWIVAALFCFRLTQDLYGKSAACIAALLFATLPFFFAVGLVMTPDAPLTAAWAGALFFLGRALLEGRRGAWLGVGLCIGLGLLSKYTIALLGPAGLLFMAIAPRSRAWFTRPWPYLAALLALLLFSPVIVWNAQHDWASFVFQGPRRLNSAFRFSLLELVASVAVLLSPVGLVAAVRALSSRAGNDPRALFIAVFTLAPLSVFLAFSLFHEVKLDWTGPLWLAVLPKVAAEIGAGVEAMKGGALRRVWGPTIAVLLAIYGAGLHYMVLGLPGLGYGPNVASLPVAWRELGRQAALIEEKLEAAKGEELIEVGMDKYFLSSQLAFYDPDNDGATHTAGRSLVGRDSLMYDYWFLPRHHAGRTVLLFALRPEDLSAPVVTSRFESMDAVREEIIYKRSKEAGRLYYRVGYNYRPS